MSKGSKRRPCLAPRWLVELRWMLAYGTITREQFDKAVKEHEND